MVAELAGSFVLGIETSGPRSAVALTREDRLLIETARLGTSHNEVLLEMVDELLARTGRSLDELSAIGVTAGPGMFTALRVGLATAVGLALPRGLPVKSVGTLTAIAETCSPARRVLTLVDARRGQVYFGFYDNGQALIEPRLADPAEVAAALPALVGTPAVMAGSGVESCRESFAGFDVIDTGIRSPSALAVAVLAGRELARTGPDKPEAVVPRYLRRTDAELNRDATVDSDRPAGS